MVLAGVNRKCGRHEQHVRACRDEAAVQFGKAQVVANRKADPKAPNIERRERLPGRCAGRLSERRAVLQSDVEQMDLSIRAHEHAVRTEDQSGVDGLAKSAEASGNPPATKKAPAARAISESARWIGALGSGSCSPASACSRRRRSRRNSRAAARAWRLRWPRWRRAFCTQLGFARRRLGFEAARRRRGVFRVPWQKRYSSRSMVDYTTGAMQEFGPSARGPGSGPVAGLVLLYAESWANLPAAFPFRKERIVIGREPGVDLELEVPAVSRKHDRNRLGQRRLSRARSRQPQWRDRERSTRARRGARRL